MEKLASRVIGFVVLLAFGIVMSVVSDAGAREIEDHGRYVGGKGEFQAVEVGDVDGHVVGSYHGTGVIFGGETFGAHREIDKFRWRTFDIFNEVGLVRGFIVHVFKDGSTITYRSEGEAKLDDNKKQYFEGTFQCISGTGRWKGIQCEGNWKESHEANGMHVGEWRATLTLPD